MNTRPKEWAREAGYTDEKLAAELRSRGKPVHVVTLNRYLNGKRTWPFPIIVEIKELAKGKLTDEDFLAPRRTRRRKAA